MKRILISFMTVVVIGIARVALALSSSGCGDGGCPDSSCKCCDDGKACGDSCISKSATCNQPDGCACNE